MTMKNKDEVQRLWSEIVCTPFPTPPLSSFVTSGKLFNLCFLTCQIGIMAAPAPHCVARSLDDVILVKCLEQCLAYSKH